MRQFNKVGDIDVVKDALTARINAFLRSKGWTYTCDTPGSYWLWSRLYEGNVIMVDTTHALGIQRYLDQDK